MANMNTMLMAMNTQLVPFDAAIDATEIINDISSYEVMVNNAMNAMITGIKPTYKAPIEVIIDSEFRDLEPTYEVPKEIIIDAEYREIDNKGIDDVVDGTHEKLDKTAKKADLSNNKIIKLIKSFNVLDKVQKGMKAYDEFITVSNKLDGINDGSQTMADLQNKVFSAASKSRGEFTSMAGVVTKLQSSTGNLFKSNDETIAFTELMQKSYVASGATKAERSTGMNKVSDIMEAGKLDGSGLKDISKTAPLIYEAISKYTKKSGDELMDLAEKGDISSNDIKNAMYAMSGEINDKFKDMPMTFEDIWTRVKDAGTQAFSGIFIKIGEVISSPQFQNFIDELVNGFTLIGNVANFIIDFMISKWDELAPVLAILAGVYLISIVAGLWSMIPPIIMATWPLLAIMGIILVIVGIVRLLGVTWEQIFGFIGGVVGVFGAIFFNIFIQLYNTVAQFVNFFATAFQNPIASLKIAIADWGISFLSSIENVAKGIQGFLSFIGVDTNISLGISNMKNALIDEKNNNMKELEPKEVLKRKELIDLDVAATMTGDKFTKFYQTISGTGETKDPAPEQKYPDPEEFSSKSNPLVVEGTGSGGNVNVDMADEDIGYLRDIAERDYIANIASNSLAPNISIKFGDVHENADAEKIAGRIQRILQEEIAIASEGVY